MEQNNFTEFSIICNDRKHLEATIQWYNRNYKTNFEIIEYTFDEVNFAKIRVSIYKISDIFSIGYQFGVKEQKLREMGEIDW